MISLKSVKPNIPGWFDMVWYICDDIGDLVLAADIIWRHGI